jgi:polysaccharide chain length determinant protein (PEP-CTERM system associated)
VRLSEARARLEELQQKFTDQHPDVLAARRHVEDLESEVAMRDPKTSDEGKKQEANPVYGQIRLKLVEAETAVPAAKERLDAVLEQLQKAKTLSADLPDVDAKAKDLDRDYEIIKKNHDELVQRREAALLSQAADEQADRTQFRIIDPPQVPLLPSFPNLPLMFSLVLVAGVAVAVALPIGYELLLGTYASASRLRSLGLPVIGAVTFVPRPNAQRRILLGVSGAMATLVGLLLAYGALMLFSVGAYAAGL